MLGFAKFFYYLWVRGYIIWKPSPGHDDKILSSTSSTSLYTEENPLIFAGCI
jgi:hypothetical protein